MTTSSVFLAYFSVTAPKTSVSVAWVPLVSYYIWVRLSSFMWCLYVNTLQKSRSYIRPSPRFGGCSLYAMYCSSCI
jgi:hypothetical protein